MKYEKYIFGDQKGKINLQSAKAEFGLQNQYALETSIGNFTCSKKNILLGVKKAKISLWSPKKQLEPQNIKNKYPY
jgi:hypothetical protein